MIGASATSVNETIHEALAKATAAVEQVGVSRWSFTLSNGKPLKATGRIEDGWFLLDAALHTGKKRRPIARARVWELLCCNASIPWGGKFALSPGGRSIRLRAEIPMLDDEVDLAARIGNVCAGLKAALRMFRRKKTARHARSLAPRADVCRAEDKVDLPGLLTESGWPFAERSGGALTVELDVPDAFYQATVQEQKHQGVRASVELAAADSWPKECRLALGVLLLTACGIVRMARGRAEEAEGRTAVGFEALLGRPTCAAELAQALSALSVICRLCGREAQALQERLVAREYLAVRGWSP